MMSDKLQLVGVREETLLCAISVFSVPLWLTTTASLPQRHGEHRDCTEKNPNTFYSIDNLTVARDFCGRPLSLLVETTI
jgi:hypothetical protein